MSKEYNRLYQYLLQALNDDVDLAAWTLKNAGVGMVAGTAFGAPGHLRLSYATNMENVHICVKDIRAAMSRRIKRPGLTEPLQ